jgi:nucleoside permease NupC
MSISDWIAFLVSVRDSALNTVLSVGAMLLAFVGLIYAEKTEGIWEVVIYTIVILFILGYVFYKIFSPMGKQERKANAILKKIIEGSLTTPDEIKIEWLKK